MCNLEGCVCKFDASSDILTDQDVQLLPCRGCCRVAVLLQLPVHAGSSATSRVCCNTAPLQRRCGAFAINAILIMARWSVCSFARMAISSQMLEATRPSAVGQQHRLTYPTDHERQLLFILLLAFLACACAMVGLMQIATFMPRQHTAAPHSLILSAGTDSNALHDFTAILCGIGAVANACCSICLLAILMLSQARSFKLGKY